MPTSVITANGAMQTLVAAAALEVVANGQESVTDTSLWCASPKHAFLYSGLQDGLYRYDLQRGA